MASASGRSGFFLSQGHPPLPPPRDLAPPGWRFRVPAILYFQTAFAAGIPEEKMELPLNPEIN